MIVVIGVEGHMNESEAFRDSSEIEIDLTDMANVDVPSLIDVLTNAELVFALYPGGDRSLLQGEEPLKKSVASEKTKSAEAAVVRVANREQAHMVAGALKRIRKQRMDPPQAARFGSLLRSVQK